MGSVFNIQRFCLHDGDGIRTTVFLKGCPLRCIWCHNPESWSGGKTLLFREGACTACGRCLGVCRARSIMGGGLALDRDRCALCGACVKICPARANEIAGEDRTAEEVIAEVLKDQIFYASSGGGMTLSGGEPAFQPEFSQELFRLARGNGISCAMETSGAGAPGFFRAAAEMGVQFLFDIKCMDGEKHRRLTGADNGPILQNLLMLFDLGADVVLRLPLVPGVNDSEEDLSALSDFLLRHAGKYRYCEIMPYHSMGAAKARRAGMEDAFSAEDAAEEDKARWTKFFETKGIDVRVSE